MNHDQKLRIETAHYLVVDSAPEMRALLSNVLSGFGVTRIVQAAKADEARQRMTGIPFDVVLSDLTLVNRFDGLYLLEEVRNQHLLKPSAVFMMVTAEANAKSVLSAAEHVPDEYILKPFSAETLRVRLERTFYKKQVFRVVDDAILKHDYVKALALCNFRIADNDLYALDFMKLKAYLCLQMGDAQEALKTYQTVLKTRPQVWAKLGLGKALLHLKAYEEAQHAFELLISENPHLMVAYDGLARCLEARKDTLGAQALLLKAVNLSPATIHRLRHLGVVAKTNQDWSHAVSAYTATIDYGQHSFHHDPLDYAHLSHAQLKLGDFAAAELNMARVRNIFDTPQARVLAQIMESRITYGKQDFSLAAQQLDAALRQYQQIREQVGATVAIELAGACFVSERQDVACGILRHVLRDHNDQPDVLRHIELMLKSVGKEQAGEALIQEESEQMTEIQRQVDELLAKGDLDSALMQLTRAVAERQHHLGLLCQTVSVTLAYVKQHGWQPAYMATAKQYLARIHQLAPTYGKYPSLMAEYLECESATTTCETASEPLLTAAGMLSGLGGAVLQASPAA
ncbi:response regulator [Leeia oryzae]|uniref:response regulator n=1 Tax=Leeia oryzae TaxID=356662 RepID=UPI0003738A8F|nr:response regulator [Leeia oryzae]